MRLRLQNLQTNCTRTVFIFIFLIGHVLTTLNFLIKKHQALLGGWSFYVFPDALYGFSCPSQKHSVTSNVIIPLNTKININKNH